MHHSFALYRLPGATTCVWCESKEQPLALARCSALDGRSGFLFAPFRLTAHTPLLLVVPDVIKEMSLDELPSIQGDMHFMEHDDSAERERYQQVFARFHQALCSGELQKVVLSRRAKETALQDIDPLALFKEACLSYPQHFVALVSTPQSGTWLMATPEILLQRQQGRWHTMALAGTMPSSHFTTTEEPLHSIWSDKNIREQQYVSDYIRECLNRHASDISESAPQTLLAGQVMHIVTHFHFSFDAGQSLGCLIQALHPTPAVCGMPKREAYDFILQHEQHDRLYYSGFAGPLQLMDETQLFVTLRCMQLEQRQYTLYAGGGLLKDSVAEKEWHETEYKMQTIRKCLAIKRTSTY